MESLAPVDPLYHAKGFDAQITAMRDTTKWHALAIAGIVGVLLSGIKLTDFSRLQGSQLLIVLAASSLGFLIVAVGIVDCSRVLSLRRPSLTELLKDEGLCQEVETGPMLLLRQYQDVKTLNECHEMEERAYALRYLITYEKSFIHIAGRTEEYQRKINLVRLLECRLAAYEVLAYAHLLMVQRAYARCQALLGSGFFVILLVCTVIGMILGAVG